MNYGSQGLWGQLRSSQGTLVNHFLPGEVLPRLEEGLLVIQVA